MITIESVRFYTSVYKVLNLIHSHFLLFVKCMVMIYLIILLLNYFLLLLNLPNDLKP
jgi:hypothetical protein